MKTPLDRLYSTSPQWEITDEPKILVLSDLHIGDKGGSDDFRQNSDIYLRILEEYYSKDFTLILLGDIEELWEEDLIKIIPSYPEIFKWHWKYQKKKRLIKIVGNHDIFTEEEKFLKRVRKILRKTHPELVQFIQKSPSIPSLKLILPQGEFFLFHGHQLDFFSNTLWKLSRFFVRYVWKPLQIVFRVTTSSPAKIEKKRNSLENKYYLWAAKKKLPIICGHTHRAAFASRGGKQEGEGDRKWHRFSLPVYFNSGCGIYTDRKITGIEIEKENIRLVEFFLSEDELKKEILGEETLARLFSGLGSIHP